MKNVISDYFYKESASFPYLWQKRFFQLFEEDTGDYILYRVKERDGKPKGRISVARILEVIPYTNKETEQRFKIVIPNRTYLLKAMSVDMRKRWERAIRASIKKMEEGPGSTKESKMVQSLEDMSTVASMQEFITILNQGMRFLNGSLSSDDKFNKFAKHMGMNSYFDLASYAPIFEKFYRDIYSNATFMVEVKLENTSSIELAKEKFEKFLMIVEQKPLKPNLKAKDLEAHVSKMASDILKVTEKYQKEAVKIEDETIIKGMSLITDFFRMMV
eukprot:CAMPEP_0114523224 /NCGR_PEP_ID=MMETSP0109-20121206/21178_1 /TAXON_ID=29199 /ORGANISM="Chlorarachnion reptans, Strain CCCM449" /LENGTH=273 /DNA_ID=CAMNT_0001704527 /DNA_START=42 /DNA_END=863 /DNA_ORIENTATION=-